MTIGRKSKYVSSKDKVLCNGGFIDGLFKVNRELRKRGKSEAIGFEKDQKAARQGHNRIRFFDKNNKTVWLPDDIYKKINLEFIKCGAMDIGRFEYPELLASGNCKNLSSWLQKKKQQFRTMCSKLIQRYRNI